MSLIRRGRNWPFRVFDDIFEDFWEPFDFSIVRTPRVVFPKLDIKEEENEYRITAEVPGYAKEEINIELHDDTLTIFSEHKEETEEEKEGYLYRERSHRSFTRSFKIPDKITHEEIVAKLENGLLTLRIPKKEPEPPKKVEIKEHELLEDMEVKETETEEKE
ncbi:MAG: Hsp20/alpha crystallin family protein [Candidatus Helarchaeota archaeon]|nr:Hsp20/alpha crystallin family protein [Candidatus Helarchaeota archaeon]